MKKVLLSQGSIYYSHMRSENGPENMNSRHCHDRYEILYIAEGSGKYIVEGAEYPVRARTLMIFPPLVYHCVSVDVGTVYERSVLHFDEKDVECLGKEIIDAFNGAEDGAGVFYSAESISDSVTSIFEKLEASESLPEYERCIFMRLLTSELLLLLSVAKKEKGLFDEGELGARVIKYLNEHIDKDISLDKLAKRFFVSKYYLCRAFKKHNGISVHGYINQKRVMYAKQLIESGETASGAAYRVGFGDYSAFYRAYVKLVGRSPMALEDGKESR